MTAHLEVLATGPLSTVQDLGRTGHAALGVPRSGAADRGAARRANRLVGNPEGAACVEATLGGLRCRATEALTVAITGAPCPVTVDGTHAGRNVRLDLPAGATVALGPPPTGLRTYLAVRGGLDVAPVLGSRATDTLGQLGPPPLQPGDLLPIGDLAADYAPVDLAPAPDPDGGEVTLGVILGPRADWFTDAARRALLDGPWRAASDSGRIGVRLTGPDLPRRVTTELASEGLTRGAIQVPPDAPPTLMLADHPVTGGYPVIAVVATHDVDRAAQLRPGQPVRFRTVGPGGGGR